MTRIKNGFGEFVAYFGRLAAALIVLASACGGSKDAARACADAGHGGANSGGTADAAQSAGADPSDSRSCECRASIDEVGQRCPPTFDGASENLPVCTYPGQQQIWICASVIALNLGSGAYSVDCYYDMSSHVLLGAMDVNDTDTFCGNSFIKVAGDIPESACRFPVAMPTFYRSCVADAGRD
jgi:hypothetical protein